MTKPDQNIKTLLDQWGRWKVRENSLAIGYPSLAAFAREYVDGARSVGNEMLIDDDLQRVNDVVNRLRPELKQVVVCKYITRLDKGEKPWQRISMSQQRFSDSLNSAVKQVAHEMGGKYQIEEDDYCLAEFA